MIPKTDLKLNQLKYPISPGLRNKINFIFVNSIWHQKDPFSGKECLKKKEEEGKLFFSLFTICATM
jgi:hypothetical protein